MATTKKQPLEAAVEEAKAPEETEEQLDAVIIVKTVDEKGNVGTSVALNGNIQPTEVQTLIEFGLQGWRKQLGLSD